MKIRARANGNIIEMADDGAKQLIEAGIYEAVEKEPKAKAEAPPVQPKGRKTR